jgi:hypothetical protein
MIGTKFIGHFQTDYGKADVFLSHYQADADFPAIFLLDKYNEPIATLSVYIEGVELKPSEFLAKTWSENERIAEQALASGLFEPTGKVVPTGYVEAEVWKIKGKGDEH